MRSLSEIDVTAKRASKAMGFSWGISEEIGKNVRLLELFGLPGLKNLNNYFKIYKRKSFQNISLISKSNISKIPYCPIISGVNFLDQISVLEELNEIDFENVAFPILFIPFLSRSSEIIGKKIFLKLDKKEFLLNFNQTIYTNIVDQLVIEKANTVRLSFIENNNSFSDKEWQEIYKLSENTFVEENDSLKKHGAGAGLTDND